MVAGLPGADRRAIMDSGVKNMYAPALVDAMESAYHMNKFEPNPVSCPLENPEFSYETSLNELFVSDIVTILNDLIDERL